MLALYACNARVTDDLCWYPCYIIMFWFLDPAQVFQTSATVNAQTRGIWMHLDEERKLVILDSEVKITRMQ